MCCRSRVVVCVCGYPHAGMLFTKTQKWKNKDRRVYCQIIPSHHTHSGWINMILELAIAQYLSIDILACLWFMTYLASQAL